MAFGKKFLLALGSVGLVLTSACSSSSDGGNTLLTASQDLSLDPTGLTTVVTFQKNLPATLSPGNFTADGGQIALNVVVVDAVATVTWDDRVSPSHQITPVGVKGVSETAHPVTTTDTAAPTFAITAATQVAGLGGDTISVAFSGANVIEAQVEDIANWDLVVNGTSMDLTGSTFAFDPVTQTLDVTLGATANLHAAFDLAATSIFSVADVQLAAGAILGAATGDTTPPTFVSAVQNLTASEFGFVVDVTFSEAMDPVFATQLSNFDGGFPVFASAVEQVADETLRVTFTNPMVPGLDVVDLVGDLMDAHGNALTAPGAPVAITAGSTVANAYSVDPVLDAVENLGGDMLTVLFDQAIDPDSAEEHARWNVESPAGTPLDLSTATLSYDLLTKTLTIELGEDVLTGDTFEVGPGAGPDLPVDVDGQDFTTVFAGTVTGDALAVSVESITQDRGLDADGLTYDVALSEQVDSVEAENTANWTVTGGATVTTATLLPSLNTVRIVLDTLAIPGEDTFTVAALEDLAGNAMAAPQSAITIVSTDLTAPNPSNLIGYCFQGGDNDIVELFFDDTMIQSEVEDPLNWTVEMPAGTTVDTTNATVSYDSVLGKATLTFDGGDQVDLKIRSDIDVTLSNMRDVGGNTIASDLLQSKVAGEGIYPIFEAAWVDAGDPTRVHVQFSEPMDFLDDIGLTGATSYVLRDGGGLIAGTPATVTVDADRQGAVLRLGFAAVAGTHTLDINGLTDLAGNALFPVFDQPLVVEDATEPGLDAGLSTTVTVSGEENDVVTVEFDRPMSRWGITDPDNFSLSDGSAVDLTDAEFEFDGDATLTIRLNSSNAPNLGTGDLYTLSANNLRSAQGVVMTGASVDTPSGAGDGAAAAQTSLRTRVDAANATDSVLVEFNEAVDETEAADATNFEKGGITADTATRLGYRTVRATWAAGVTAGDTIDVTMADLAGNIGVTNQIAETVVATGPALSTVAGLISPGFGGDRVVMTFNVPLNPTQASTLTNYTVEQGGTSVDLTGAFIRASSTSNQVSIHLAEGVELDPLQDVRVTVDNVENQDGIAISPTGDLTGAVSGDVTPADFDEAFVNYRVDSGGMVIDVRFTEDVDPTFAGDPSNFTVSGGQTVNAAEVLDDDVVRLTISAPMILTETIGTVDLPDAAGITSGAISIAPAL